MSRIYRGEQMELSKVPPGSVVQFLEPAICRFGYGQAPPIAIASRVQRYSASVSVFYFWREVGKGLYDVYESCVYLPSNQIVNVMNGTKANTILQSYNESVKISHPSRMSVTSGTDPELFVVGKENKIIPAWEFLPSKEKPLKTTHNNDLYWDGFQAEFTIPGGACLESFCSYLFGGMRNTLFEARKKDGNATISANTVMPVDPEILKTANPEHVRFGCMPSLNVYGMSGSKQDGRETPFRFVGGHIHFGFSGYRERIPEIIMSMDKILGVACVSLFADFDNPIRRQYYGLAGEYRTPAHGIEYRTLSNAWLIHPLVTNMVMELARVCLFAGIQGRYAGWESSQEETIKAIQECDVDLARSILKRNEKALARLWPLENGKLAASLFQGSVDKFIDNPTDIVGNWALDGPFNYLQVRHVSWYRSYLMLSQGKKV